MPPALMQEIEARRCGLQIKHKTDNQREVPSEGARRRWLDQSSSPIGRFNATHPLKDMLLRYGYEMGLHGDSWRSPHQRSGSYATRIFIGDDGQEYFVSLSESDAVAGLGEQTTTGARHGDAFDIEAHYGHNGDRKAALTAWEDAEEALRAQRRKQQHASNALIGSGQTQIPTTEVLTLPQMLARHVYIRDGSQVAEVDRPSAVLTLSDFRNAYAGSKHQITNPDGSNRTVAAVKAWLENKDRLEAETLTFHAGAGQMTHCPRGRQALNLWKAPARPKPPDNWQAEAKIFEDHLQYLWGEDTDTMLDWLAHIEQKPGQLPHFGWLHTSPAHGTGRNWIASVLVRLWPGHVAASLDLVSILEGNFNDRLSQCLLAIVDEIAEGGAHKHRNANRLRQLVTAEQREINPKYGRKRVEHNAARWLVFSNHVGALPLDDRDRRFWVVCHKAPPKEPPYYQHLYKKLEEPNFIASVAELLRQRDISGFNPGQIPPMNAAKEALVDFSRSEADLVCRDVAQRWPVDLITSQELDARLPLGSKVTDHASRHAMERAGLRKVAVRVRIRKNASAATIYSVRDHDSWAGMNASAVRTEVMRISADQKTAAMDQADE